MTHLLRQELQLAVRANTALCEMIVDNRHSYRPTLYCIVPVTVSDGRVNEEIYALMGSGSSISIIEDNLGRKLELRGSYISL